MSDEEWAGEDEFNEEETWPLDYEDTVEISDDDDSLFDEEGEECVFRARLETIVNTYNAYIFESPALLQTNIRIKFSLPRSILPLSYQAVYGFLSSSNLIDVIVEIAAGDFKQTPIEINIAHPVYGIGFIGRPLVQTACDAFFTAEYKPKPINQYKSVLHLVMPNGQSDTTLEYKLIDEGATASIAQAALILSENNLDDARNFVMTGAVPPNAYRHLTAIPDYTTCPLLYLALELAEAFLDLPDCCCICRKKLILPGVRPSICDNKFCQFRLTEIGIGNSLIQEIKRDPDACDLLVSLFGASEGTKFQTPAPGFTHNTTAVLAGLPQMRQMAMCASDTELTSLIGIESYQLIRWIVLSNLSFIMSLPPSMKISQFGSSKQFLTLISSAQAEKAFIDLKKKHGSLYLWHGSDGCKWHSIVRNGLKNATGTHLEANGHAHGAGIYFAPESSTSWSYSRTTPNIYKQSAMGKELHIIGLCEVANVRELKTAGSGWCRTLTNEAACVVRFLMVGGNFNVNVVNSPPTCPTLKQVLQYHATSASV